MNPIETKIINMCHELEDSPERTSIERPIFGRLALKGGRSVQVTIKLETDKTLWIKGGRI